MPFLSPAVLFVFAAAQLFPARRQLKAGPTGSKTHSSQTFLFVDHYTFKFFLLLYWSKQTMSLITGQIVLFCFRSITRVLPGTVLHLPRACSPHHLLGLDMVLELGGFIEPDNPISPPNIARSGKSAQHIETGEVILVESRPHKSPDFSWTNVPSPMVSSPLEKSGATTLYERSFSSPLKVWIL